MLRLLFLKLFQRSPDKTKLSSKSVVGLLVLAAKTLKNVIF